MKNTLILLATILFFAGSLSSCKFESKPKIGFLLPNFKSDRYVKEKGYFSEKVTQLGGETLVASAENDDRLQIKQAEEMISQGTDILVINSVNRFTAAAIVRIAHDANVKVIAYDRLIDNSDLDYYISFDSEKAGELMVEYAIRKFPEGKYLIFGGDKRDLNATLLKEGQLKVLQPHINSGKIQIEYDVFIEDWSEIEAKHTMKQYLVLSGEVPDAIICSYDGISSGVITALKEQGLGKKVIVTGQDAELIACRNIVKGDQSMTIFKSLKTLASKAAEISINLALEKAIISPFSVFNGKKDVPATLLEPIAVDASNLKNTVIAEGQISETELYVQ